MIDELLPAATIFAAASQLAAALLMVPRRVPTGLTLLVTLSAGAGSAALVVGQSSSVAVITTAFLFAEVTAMRRMSNVTPAIVIAMVAFVGFLVASVAAWGSLVTTLDAGYGVRCTVALGVLVALIAALPLYGREVEQWLAVGRRVWLRTIPVAPAPSAYAPSVCVHVPTYSEPPELVIATLDALAAVEYPSFEVLVIDNNTCDPALWRPVQAHCRALGDRFRFVHVDGLTGAKSGALNLALEMTRPGCELIAVVDSDNIVTPDFLSALVPPFADSRVAAVQAPHDFYGWEHSRFKRAAYWEREYRLFHRGTQRLWNEDASAMVAGSLAVLRRSALERVGGWWSGALVEDCELTTRLHACGYETVWLAASAGRGQIPDTFAAYKCQRRRWARGRVQVFRRHWRLCLPRPLARRSGLRPTQKLRHVIQGTMITDDSLLLLPLALALTALLAVDGRPVPVPLALPVASVIALLSRLLLELLAYCRLGGATPADGLHALLARFALAYTSTASAVGGMLANEMDWRRTSKFRSDPSRVAAVCAAGPELAIGVAALAAAGFALTVGQTGLLLAAAAQLGWTGVIMLTAPAMALLADRDLRRLSGDAARPAVRRHTSAESLAPGRL